MTKHNKNSINNTNSINSINSINNKDSYIQLTIRFDPQLKDDVIVAMNKWGIETFWEGSIDVELNDPEYQSQNDLFKSFNLEGEITCYINSMQEVLKIKKHVQRHLLNFHHTVDLSVQTKLVHSSEWQNWRKQIKTITIGNKLVIAPTWETTEIKSNQILIQIDPEMAFGTGQNESTQGVLDLMLKTWPDSPPKSFIDVGCGSGIIAIAAEKLGAESVHGFDYDPTAVEIAVKNANLNKCSKCLFWQQDIKDLDPILDKNFSNKLKEGLDNKLDNNLDNRLEKKYELVCVNMISSNIINNKQRILNVCQPGGTLILSGILLKEHQRFLNIWKLEPTEIWQQGDWISFAFKKLSPIE